MTNTETQTTSGNGKQSTTRITTLLETARRCLRLLDCRARVQLSWLTITILVGTALEAIGISTVFPLLEYIVTPDKIDEHHYLNVLIPYLPGEADSNGFIIAAVVAMTAAFVLKNLILLAVTYGQFTVIYHNERRIACELFDNYMERPYAEILDRNSADLIRNVREVVSFAFKSVVTGFINIAIEGLMILTILGLMIFIEPVSALIACAFIFPGALFYQYATRATLHRLGHENLLNTSAILKAVQEGLQSLKQTKVFGRELFFGDIFKAAKLHSTRIAILTGTISQTPRLWFETLVIFSAATVVLVLVATSSDTIAPLLGLFAIAMLRMIPSANRLSLAINNIRNGGPAMMVLEAELADARHRNRINPKREDAATLDKFQSLEMQNVDFSYPGGKALTLEGINLRVNAGEHIALVGPSGSGKTTTADIMLGLLVPASGRLLVNQTEAEDVIGQWRKRLAYVPQHVYVSDDTLRRNVAFALPDDAIDDEKVTRALRDAQLDHLIDDLPDGLDTTLGEGGRRLSVGQQQRIGIARALYEQPEFLVMDEATSALDLELEHEIVNVLENLRHSLTIVVIAHRLSTVKNADKIIMMDRGRIVGADTFDHLVRDDDQFARLVELTKL